MHISDDAPPRYDPERAAWLACAEWDFDAWVFLGCPLSDSAGRALQLHDEMTVTELRQLFYLLSRHTPA